MSLPQVVVDRAFVRETIDQALSASGLGRLAADVVSRVGAAGRALVFGGLLRNAVLARLFSEAFPVRDLDIVVFGLGHDDDLRVLFRDESHRQNSFGGLKVDLGGVFVDVWRAELQGRIAGVAAPVTTVEGFLRCVTLTCDAVLFDVVSRSVYEDGFVRSTQEETIDLGADNRWIQPWLPYHLAHVAYVAAITRFRLSAALRMRIRDAASDARNVDAALAYLCERRKHVRPKEIVERLLEQATAPGGDGKEAQSS